MLSKKDAIGFESQNGRIYKFVCSNPACDRVLRVRSSYLKQHSGLCVSCVKHKPPYWSTYNNLRGSVKRRNKRRGSDLEFALTFEEFLFLTQIRVCYYCEEPNIEWLERVGNGKFRYNLDRKDNNRGYTFDNVAVCCKECNQMKREWFTSDEFRAMRLLLKRWREGTQEERDELMLMLVSWNNTVIPI